MSKEIQIFKNEEFGNIRGLQIDGDSWLVGKDATIALGYSNFSDALKRHVDEEDKKKIAFHDYPELGNKGAVLINESGLYSLILRSDMPKAKQFKRWVTSEVLPSIRKTGSYQSQQQLINGLNETIEQMQETIEEYKSMCKITCSKKRNYTDYIKKALGINKANKEFDRVKARIFLVLGVTKWEDIDFETSKNILSVIDESIRVAKRERPYKQMSYFD
ncbi:BRO family protein [Clostridium sp.]|uniref:BRO-N domain-containing protein n=1 Tax=Clostridium sp. TaxID=1506 RepID=UPI0025C16D71|nr:BRO family protein [Clostridium sp.]